MTGLRVVIVVCLVAFAGGALADEQTDAQARAYYDKAQTHYAIGQFDKAIELYKQAYELSKRPSLLFNIAQSYRLSKDPKQAKFFYESYLRAVPDAANRPEVEQRITQMDQEIAEAAKAKAARPVVPEVRTEKKPGLFYGGIATMGVGVVGVGLGVFFGLRAKHYADEVDGATTAWSASLEDAEKKGKTAEKISIAMYGVGGGLLIAGGVLTFLGRPRKISEGVAIQPMLGPGAGVSVRGSF